MAETRSTTVLTARGALDSHVERLAALEGPVTARIAPLARQYDIRVTTAPAADAVAAVLGVALPAALSWRAGRAGITVIWLGPDEWLVSDPAGSATLEAELRDAIGGAGSVVEQSGQRISLLLSGEVTDLLSKGTGLDLRPRSFGAGAALQGILGQAVVIFVSRSDDGSRVEVIARTSFARYVAEWLLDAAQDPPARPSAHGALGWH